MLECDLVTWADAWAMLGAGVGIAILGFLDDHGHIAAKWRLLGHFLAAIWAVIWLGGLPTLSVFGHAVQLRWIGDILAVFYIVWMLNLYNFMDGIDGIASVEAIFSCMGMAALYVFSGHAVLAPAPLILAATVAGFLCWNFPPAKIFMGDAGSGYLGVLLALLSLQAAWVSSNFFWAWLIMLGVFVVDATFTLMRRLLRGEKIYEAHRSHGYQYAARKYKAHRTVTLGVAVINVCWLLPLAAAVVLFDLDGFLALIIAYAPLILLCVSYRAGHSEG
jgi:Fuc2NAc and GlcNAc transferase